MKMPDTPPSADRPKHLPLLYRTEIDGLRAIAIAGVILFHFFPDLLPLGYVGVDLFFVISGFLMSSYVIQNCRNGIFSFREFYHRRIRRILPATLAVSIVTSLMAAFILTPPDFVSYSRSLVSTLLFVANIYFWRTGGYFGSNDELKPLLHMWSLGVEEQFYILFPITIFILLKFVRRTPTLMTAVFGVSLISLLANIAFLRIGGANPAFFLLPTRAWQFGCGVLAAVYYLDRHATHTSWSATAAFVLLCAGFFVSSATLPAGLVVTLGASLFLAGRIRTDTPVARITRNVSVRAFGLMSFSLYLWHWPILVFIKYYTVGRPPLAFVLAGLAATVLLSMATYKFVERPFRKMREFRRILPYLLPPMALLMAFSFVSISLDGITSRDSTLVNTIASATQTNYRCPVSDYIPYGGSRACYINKGAYGDYDTALVGNSHAQMYVPSIRPVFVAEHRRGLLIPLNACLPTIDLNISADCLRLANENFRAFMADPRIKTVIFALTWYSDSWVLADGSRVDDPHKLLLAHSLLRLIGRVRASHRQVFLVGPIEIPGFDASSILSRKLKFGYMTAGEVLQHLKVPRQRFDQTFDPAIRLLALALKDRLLLPHEILCDSRFCRFGDRDAMYFADASHLSLRGTQIMKPLFWNALHARLPPAAPRPHASRLKAVGRWR